MSGNVLSGATVMGSPSGKMSIRVMHMRRGLPLISALQEPHLPALQFQRTARSLAAVRLDAVNDVEDDHALLERHPVLVELPALPVAAEDVHRHFTRGARGRRHFFSSNSVPSSDGIAGKGSWVTVSCPSRIRTTTFTLPKCASGFG